MDIDILDSLEDLGYSGSLINDEALKNAIELGPKSIEFTELTEWLSKELQVLCNLEGLINAITDPEESSTFLLEVSSFLKELYCPYDCLMDGPISQRLIEKKNRILLLDFLCSELQAARLVENKTQDKRHSLDIEMDTSVTASSLDTLMKSLDMDLKADLVLEPEELFENAKTKVEQLIASNPHLCEEPIMSEEMSPDQWSALQNLKEDMHLEYKIRREMLLTRLDVTVQSFKWGENVKGKEDQIMKIFLPLRTKLKADPAVVLADVLAAREDVTILEKTSSAMLVRNTKSSLNRILIGAVPDRGGRPKEQRPPVEMPGWQKRSQSRGGGDYRGGRGKKFHKRGKW